MKIAFIGVGNVGAPLADCLQKLGHEVTIAARDASSKSVRSALERNPDLLIQAPAAVSLANIILLATPFENAAAALTPLSAALDGKVLVDCTNPVSANLTHGLESKLSGSEMIQQLLPNTRVVKAFTIYGYENFDNSSYPGYGDLKPAMLIAGDDRAAKDCVADLCRQLGWEPVDTGNLSMSLHLEHMTLLWIKMARVQGHGAGFTWAMLQR